MAINKEAKQYYMATITSMVIDKLHVKYKQYDKNTLMCKFTQSKTYALLLDAGTGLWTQSPDYIIELYQEELNKG